MTHDVATTLENSRGRSRSLRRTGAVIKLNRSLRFESLEHRWTLAGDLSFAEPIKLIETSCPTECDGGYSEVLVGITSGDFNGDGRIDLALTKLDTSAVSVRLGNEDGTFQVESHYAVPSPALGTIAADFDNDGFLDLAVKTHATEDGITILRNRGDGSFESTATMRIEPNSSGLTAADLNGDGYPDLINANRGPLRVWSQEISVLLNNGNGTFAATVNYTVGTSPRSVVAADLNGDGHLDLAVSVHIPGSIAVLRGNGDGTFASPNTYGLSSNGLSINAGDWDSDGDVDLAVTIGGSINSGQQGGVTIFSNNGDGSFADSETYFVGHGIGSVSADDFDVDGDEDLLVYRSLTTDLYGPSEIVILRNGGDGTFDDRFEVIVDGPPWQMVSADFNGDGKPDILANYEVGWPPTRDGDEVFTYAVLFLNTTQILPRAGDSNGDGVFDQFDIVQTLQAGKYLTGQPATWQEGDWNGDGVFNELDIIFAIALGEYTPSAARS